MEHRRCRRKLESLHGKLTEEQWCFLTDAYWPAFIDDSSDVEAFVEAADTCLEFARFLPPTATSPPPKKRPFRYRGGCCFGWPVHLKRFRLNRLMRGVMWLRRTRPGITWREIHRELSAMWGARHFEGLPSVESLSREWRMWKARRDKSGILRKIEDSFYTQVEAMGAVVVYDPPSAPGMDEGRPWLRVEPPSG